MTDAQKMAGVSPPSGFRIGLFDTLPNIVLPNQNGEVMNLLDFMAGNMLILLIVADPRSPESLAQLRRFGESLAALQVHANVFVVTATSPTVNAGLRDHGLPYLLSDERGELANIVGASRQGGITVLIADERMRVQRLDHGVTDPDHAAVVLRFLNEIPRREPRVVESFAPILHVPQVFEPAFCDRLIDAYLTEGNFQGMSPKVVDGKLTEVVSPNKIRRDYIVKDQETQALISDRINKRLLPEILRAFTRHVTGLEQCKVACYEASAGGRFGAHRDNTMAAFAHRRFALSISLNTGEYEGGFLRFQEYGPELYRAPKGDAIVYSASVLHEVTPVTAGRRFVFLTQMFDEESRQNSPTFRR